MLKKPQSWNRYVYTIGNPLKYYDPDGATIKLVADDPEKRALQIELLQILADNPLPGPSAMAAAPRTGGLLLPRLAQFVSRILGVSDDAARVAQLASRFSAIEGRAAVLQKVIRVDGRLNFSETVEKQMMGIVQGKDRTFISLHLVRR